jgi:hypothetical protein
MKKRFITAFVGLALLLAGVIPAAHAALERVGPTGPFGYPNWYQDKTGLAMEFCSPLNQSELNGGWCLLLPPGVSAPEVFPTQFFDEHFYWAAGAGPINYPLPGGGSSKANLVLGLEGAFATGPVISGDQITFGRIRVNVRDLPFNGTYTVYHPYGTWVFPNQVAGTRLFFTEDIGITCPPGDFTCALASNIGPFLLPSLATGGVELPPVDATTAGLTTAYPGTGKLYIADPARVGPITGSPVGQDFFRVVGPTDPATGQPWVIETSNFSLMGRVMADAIPGRVTVDRASYTAGGAANKLDVFATAFPTTQGRLPAGLQPPAVTPVLSFFGAPCSGPLDANGNVIPPYGAPTAFGAEVQMSAAGNNYWGQAPLVTTPALVIPSKVCVEDYTARNAAGQVVPAFYQATVTDEVSVTQAAYDPSTGGTLTVAAASSDAANPPNLLLSWTGMDGNLVIAPVAGAGTFSVTPLTAPPAKVRVVSAAGGINKYQVTTGVSAGAPPNPTVPVAVNDEGAAFNTLEDTPVTVNPLTNDTFNGGPIPAGAIVTITGAPRIGTMGPVNPDGSFLYTPNLNVTGNEGIAYTVTVNGQASNVAYITLAISPVPDPPVAANDTAAAIRGISNSLNVLANDTDPDGAADLSNPGAKAVIVTWPAALGPRPVPTSGVVTFTPPTSTAAGTYTFTYNAMDAGGLTSVTPATVTVSVAAAEVITITRSDFVRNNFRWRLAGTDTVLAGQTLTITYTNGTVRGGVTNGAAGTVIGTAVVDATGAWALDQVVSSIGVLNPTNTGGNATNPTFWSSPPTQIRVTSGLSSVSTTRAISLK